MFFDTQKKKADMSTHIGLLIISERVSAKFFPIYIGFAGLLSYQPGKKGQNIGIRMMETMKQITTRPEPAFT